MAANSVLDGVSVLLENHLLHLVEQPGGEPRLPMLEIIREYGLECLEECGEAAISTPFSVCSRMVKKESTDRTATSVDGTHCIF
jgi:hypothetical protein